MSRVSIIIEQYDKEEVLELLDQIGIMYDLEEL